MDIAAWLSSIGLSEYEAAFRDNDVDAELLPSLTADDLRDLGVASVGHRRRLLAAIASLGARPETVAPVPPAAAQSTDEPAASRAERRQLTVMFVDLVGSTELSRSLDPEDMGALLRLYQNTVAGEITRFEGHVAKFMGDGVLAYFGWPAAHEDEAERAVRAALAIGAAVAAIAAPGGRALQTRIGIATGMVVVGDLIGEGGAQEETVIGETPNLAARLQERVGPGGVVISAGTRRLLGSLFRVRPLGELALKGFDAPVTAFAVLGEESTEGRFAALRATGLSPLVGRSQELALLMERWEQAKAGEGQLVQLLGEPGIGKSRVLESLRERLADEPYTRVRYFCSPYHSNSALHPITAQLARARPSSATTIRRPSSPSSSGCSSAPASGRARRCRRWRHCSACRSAIVRAARPHAATAEGADLRGAARALAGLAARQPVLILYEDLHWVDPTTLELWISWSAGSSGSAC